MKQEARRGTMPLDPAEVAALREWIAEETEAVVVEALGLSRFGTARLAAGLDVHAATRLAARAAMARRGAR